MPVAHQFLCLKMEIFGPPPLPIPLLGVARVAQRLEVLDAVAAPLGDRDDVINRDGCRSRGVGRDVIPTAQAQRAVSVLGNQLLPLRRGVATTH